MLSDAPECGLYSQTKPKCATTTQVKWLMAVSTILLVQSTPSVATSGVPSGTPPSVATSGVPSSTPLPSDAPTGYMLGGVACFVYLAIRLGALAVIVVLLVVVIIVPVCEKKMQGERECILYSSSYI